MIKVISRSNVEWKSDTVEGAEEEWKKLGFKSVTLNAFSVIAVTLSSPEGRSGAPH